MNPTEWYLSGKTGFFSAGTTALVCLWAFFRLPECKGRTYEELDLLFAKKTKTRRFAKAEVNAYASSTQMAVSEEDVKH